MPRAQRIASSTGIFHVLLRGINRQLIFEEDKDCEQFLRHLAAVKELSRFELYAYCLMGNHVHLLLKEGKEPLAQIIKRLGARYVFWFNAKYRRVGHLFQDRFKSEPVADDAYFLAVLRYIYQNPVKAGLCEKTKDYEWSSRRLLGTGKGLVDEESLAAVAPVDAIRKRADEIMDVELMPEARGRRPRFFDNEAAASMREACGASNASAFQALGKDAQRRAIGLLTEKQVPVRQLARITGLSKGVVERWARKGKQDK
ncbi:MAG: transposase [Clostridiales Family XIII bacterium]|jgi:REP element-mobilizing transposase RayT|nr:transposase [Clostridiales Family XIII bacterium]